MSGQLAIIVHAVVLGFGLIMPLGVQNVFLFQQGALQPKYRYVLPAVIVACFADTVLISTAVLGVSVIVMGSVWVSGLIMGGGVLFLIYMGIVNWRSNIELDGSGERVHMTAGKLIAYTASVSFLNPHAMLDSFGVIGTNSITYSGTDKLVFGATVLLVSYVWFFGITFVGRLVGQLSNSERILNIFNKVSAFIMWGTAAYMLVLFTQL